MILPATAQTPAKPAPGGGSEKIELKDEKHDDKLSTDVNLDPGGKLPSANKENTAEGDAANKPPEPAAAQLPPALQKLGKDQILRYYTLKDEATGYMRSVRLQEALDRLNEAEKIAGETMSELENLRGAVYTKIRDFSKAREHFSKALSLEKESFHPMFNLAELDFVEQKWTPASQAFGKLVEMNAKLREQQQAKVEDEERKEALGREFEKTARLMQFKIYICQLQEKKEKEADATMQNFRAYDDDTPAYYFAKAASSFVKGNKEEGEEWIESAKKIYPADIIEIYIDSFVEMKWLTTLN
jgi:tetratricopeptide (TPR) repeat protein